MAFMDKLKQAVRGKSAQIEQGIDKAVTEVDKRTQGKYADKLNKGADVLSDKIRDLDDASGDDPRDPGPDRPGPVG